MRIHIVARKIKMSKPIKDFIEAKIEKLHEYLDNIVWAQVIVAVEKKIHTAEVIVHAGHQTMKAAASTDEMYSAIDKAMDKMEIQVKKYKERFTDHHASENIEADEFTTLVGPEIRFSVVKDVPLKPMNKEEAVMEMEKLGFNFWLFQEKGSKQLQVVFKRLDSTYGLLQPVKK
ncbi:MAG TPA: ribosome-associated translation inhibitor RaiA [Elusimicrobia bacterium]|nr:MAG: ribosomal subunit interface protein [Elusimicrobia bacterium GWF2_62_30]HBA60970.1 ribosome-associated translation inhibitor RaiA [Elusimicrobiota bacterium]